MRVSSTSVQDALVPHLGLRRASQITAISKALDSVITSQPGTNLLFAPDYVPALTIIYFLCLRSTKQALADALASGDADQEQMVRETLAEIDTIKNVIETIAEQPEPAGHRIENLQELLAAVAARGPVPVAAPSTPWADDDSEADR